MDKPAIFVTYHRKVRDPEYKGVDVKSIPLFFRSKLYKTVTKQVKITNPTIVDIVNKAERLEISPGQASNQLKEYLLGEECMKYLTFGQYFENMSLWEKIVTDFHMPSKGRIDSLDEKYAEKHGLSGRFTMEGERKKTQAWNRICEESANKPVETIVMQDGQVGNVVRGLDEKKESKWF